MDDLSTDLMPTDGSLIGRDEDREQEENLEKAKVQAAGPVFDDLLDWFDTEIMLCDSIDGLQLESRIDLAAQVLARRIAKDKLQSQRDRLQILKDEYITP